MDLSRFRYLEINGGIVHEGQPVRLMIPPAQSGYTDAQIDDYGALPSRPGNGSSRRNYPWRPGISLHCSARFSHPIEQLTGTAGFGFWNAPFGDPTVRRPTLPQATWFFYASAPTDLPLAPQGPGRGWFAATLDATTGRALATIPFTPAVLLLNQIPSLRRRLWPVVQRHLGISYAQIGVDISQWHEYDLDWSATGCSFYVDQQPVLQTSCSPRGPLGFVCWLDNQYMIVRANGRFRWGILPVAATQWLEVADLRLDFDS